MGKKLKVAHLQLLPLLTGVQRVTLEELERLEDSKYDKFIVCKEEGPLIEGAKNKNINFFFNENLERSISPLNDLKAFIKLYKLFKQQKFDIVHSHSSKTGVIGRVAAKLAGVPMVVHTVHGFAFPAAKGRLDKLLFFFMEWLGTKCSDKIICLHEVDKNIAVDKLGAKEKQVVILANGVDTVKFSPIDHVAKNRLQSSFNVPPNTICVGMVGRLWEQKNPIVFVNAAIEILSQKKNVQFFLVGDGELRSHLEEIVEQSGFSDKVHFLGWRNDIQDILRMLDVFVLPSLWEGMPLAILEAQSSGLPSIVSNIPGNNHLVTESDGLLFNLSEQSKLNLNIHKLIANKALRESLGRAARAKIMHKYDINLRIRNISALYSSFMKDINS
ncbi:glycosyltransferase family 4 protein [Pseudoalteromonas sp. Angola-30]|uniref:glycosyltransferase family 4 protein n=1 Tax=Pseudoalteromonas sp. Angola-30 TaxID=3025341 RepID=UPI00235992B8|nr:glycosyltransferase family 4 protein [Pseudoalteromonas sp. Angola-30]MDC9524637.1 glycosyltransferase family 4 protein [Pseudoalteromonas sp. Angola-30]